MSWHYIDLGPDGSSGIEAKFRIAENILYLYVYGSDHKDDWVHHVLPGGVKREADAAEEIADLIQTSDCIHYVITGHSLGGLVAVMVAQILREKAFPVTCYAYGPKRVPKKYHAPCVVYRHRGDIVPFLPPWRPNYENVKKIGKWLPPWMAHGPSTYWNQMEKDGIR